MVGSPYLPSALSALGSSCVNWESNSSFPQKPTTKVLIRESHFAVAKSSHLSLSSTGSFGFRHLDFCEQRTALHKPSCETDKDLLRISTRMKPQPTTLRRKSGSHSTYIFKGCLINRERHNSSSDSSMFLWTMLWWECGSILLLLFFNLFFVCFFFFVF